ncbi:MAG: hypothetical protein P8Z30_20550 [Acidobacteriota bacterium]
MERDNAQLIALLEARLQHLKSLAREIKAAQDACVALDLEALRIHDHQTENLCAEIRKLDLEISRIVPNLNPARRLRAVLDAGHGSESQVGPAAARRLSGLLEESEAAREEVRRLNRVYALFLARSRKTLNVMVNVVSHCLGIYPSPQQSTSLAIPFERSY